MNVSSGLGLLEDQHIIILLLVVKHFLSITHLIY